MSVSSVLKTRENHNCSIAKGKLSLNMTMDTDRWCSMLVHDNRADQRQFRRMNIAQTVLRDLSNISLWTNMVMTIVSLQESIYFFFHGSSQLGG
jgi:hypothetical protein